MKISDIGHRIFRDFAANEWICRPDIRLFWDFAANEWIRLPNIAQTDSQTERNTVSDSFNIDAIYPSPEIKSLSANILIWDAGTVPLALPGTCT
jgi:hypothetical protein